MSDELRAALIGVLDPAAASLAASLTEPASAPIPFAPSSEFMAGLPNFNPGVMEVTAVSGPTYAGYSDGPALDSSKTVILAEGDSPFVRTFLKTGQPRTDKLLAIPVEDSAVAGLRSWQAGPFPGRNFAVDAAAVAVLDRIDRDLESKRETHRTIALPPGADAAPIIAAAARDPGASASMAPEPSVQQDIPADAVVQSLQGEGCGNPASKWPADAGQVAAIIRRNLSIMDGLGVRDRERARILVIDSGLPEGLATRPDFSRFLLSPARLLLQQHYYWTKETANLAPSCVDPARSGESGWGIVTAPRLGDCVDRMPFGGLAPLPRASGAGGMTGGADGTYMPDHAGIVGVLAAGGPELMSIDGLSELVGIGFARIHREENGHVLSDPEEVSEAFDFARERVFPVVNTSLDVTGREAKDAIETAFRNYTKGGLVVAAAGNAGGELKSGGSAYPASMAPLQGDDHLIVVAGLEGGDGGPRFWAKSNFSDSMVDLAAPAAAVPSLNGSGQPSCFNGTSAAAPQVAFAAALITAFGIDSPALVKRRLLATARHNPNLVGRVRNERALDLAAALDVFADLVWIGDDPVPRRVRLLPPAGFPDEAAILQLCAPDSGSLGQSGWIDANLVFYWEAIADRKAAIWHRDGATISALENACDAPPPDQRLRFRTEAGEIEDRAIAEVRRIVPSQLRRSLGARIPVPGQP